MTSRIETEVEKLNARLEANEAMVKFQARVQFEVLARAEKLRRLALDVVRKSRDPSPNGLSRALTAMEDFTANLTPFATQAGKMPAALKRLLRSGGKRK